MATNPPNQAPKKQQRAKGERRMFAGADDSAMMKQVQGTHAPDGRNVDVLPILHVIEEILKHVTPNIDSVLNGSHKQVEALEEKTVMADFEGMLETLAHIIHKISCEMSCKCSGGGDAHTTSMAILNMLSSYTWDAKVVLVFAAFAISYGEFWLVMTLCTSNSLAKYVALLKQLPDILENSNALKPHFDAFNKLIKASMDVTKCIFKFTELPSQYISSDSPPMSVALAHIPTAAYWTIRSIVACASQIVNLVGLRHEYIASTTEAWELSSLAHKLLNIHEHLQNQINICNQHIDEKMHIEAYQNLLHLFEIPHMDNMKILKALIYSKDDIQPLVDGTTKSRVHIEVLRKKQVLLLISDLNLSHEEILILDQMYKESRGRPELRYEIVWLPIIDHRAIRRDDYDRMFNELQALMPWHTIYHPSIIEAAVIRFIKEVWHFAKKPILVSLDPQGRVASQNALHMMWIWGNLAFPFTSEKEDSLWKAEAWKVELLVDGIDLTIFDWMEEGKFVCLFGGEDIEWIRKFTAAAKRVAGEAGISLEFLYVGKKNAKERVRKINNTIKEEKVSHFLPDTTVVWFFWARLESMLYSKIQHGRKVENDLIMQEVQTILSYDGSEQGWAIFYRGSTEMARAKGDKALKSMEEYDKWKNMATEQGFVPALNNYVGEALGTPHHCNRLVLPGISGGIPEQVVCAECGRAMEMYFLYRCCDD